MSSWENIFLIIFDLDGTLISPASGKKFKETASDWEWLPGRLAKLRNLSRQGIWTALATNQGGVGHGYHTEKEIEDELFLICAEGHISDFRVCYTHPEAPLEQYRRNDENRKPNPGMIFDLMSCFIGATTDNVLYIGDRKEDALAADSAGVHFMWAWEYFGDAPPEKVE